MIAEMGGKNAIIVDDDADLDEAVSAWWRAPSAIQGQNVRPVRGSCARRGYDAFVARLAEAPAGLSGPADEPATVVGPVIDARDATEIREVSGHCLSEGRVVAHTTSAPSPGEATMSAPHLCRRARRPARSGGNIRAHPGRALRTRSDRCPGDRQRRGLCAHGRPLLAKPDEHREGGARVPGGQPVHESRFTGARWTARRLAA